MGFFHFQGLQKRGDAAESTETEIISLNPGSSRAFSQEYQDKCACFRLAWPEG